MPSNPSPRRGHRRGRARPTRSVTSSRRRRTSMLGVGGDAQRLPRRRHPAPRTSRRSSPPWRRQPATPSTSASTRSTSTPPSSVAARSRSTSTHALAAINAGIFDIGVDLERSVRLLAARLPARHRRWRAEATRGLRTLSSCALRHYAGAPSQYSHAMTASHAPVRLDEGRLRADRRRRRASGPASTRARSCTRRRRTRTAGRSPSRTSLNSRIISWPLNLLDVCLVTDHGGAVIVASAERRPQLPHAARLDRRRR